MMRIGWRDKGGGGVRRREQDEEVEERVKFEVLFEC